jgi:hypothetical protein
MADVRDCACAEERSQDEPVEVAGTLALSIKEASLKNSCAHNGKPELK